jgi:hypothetical protein
MRDPRSGFAKSFRNRSLSRGSVRFLTELRLGAIAAACCCGCAASGNRSPPAASATAPNAETAPGARARAVALSYSAAPGCPGIERYSGHVRARSASVTFEPAGAATADSVDVRIEPEPASNGWLGHVTIAGATALDREVRGTRCEDVVAALALITVLRLEGTDARSTRAASPGSASESATATASSGAPTSTSAREGATAENSAAATTSPSESGAPADPSETPEPTAQAPARAAPSGPSSSTPDPGEVPPSAPELPAPAEPASPRTSASERESSSASREDSAEPAQAAGDGARESARAGDGTPERRTRGTSEAEIAPSMVDESTEGESGSTSTAGRGPSVRVAVAAQLGYATVPTHALEGLVQGELRFGEDMSSWATALSLAYTRSASEVDASELDITLLTARLALCPPAFIDTASVWFRACADVRGGGAHVLITPDDPSLSSGDVWRPWLAVGPALQVGVPLSQHWALRGAFELALQLVRDRFDVLRSVGADETERLTLYRPEAASFELGIGLGYGF